ncbi:carboxymuconolactone decarboxylase family protein [Actinomadura oligospora]|uniref:carboxymuconolactone decarboxylase family protein n=1 Tax=Actinomadura oligospora TaxID=111804 RepID=UPI00047C2527|nr:carboxymuconolactone decarboxylase family protein [Actinomadura oligospora]
MPRLDLFANPVAAKALKHFGAASMAIIKESTLPAATRDMVMLRASQINGCGYCTDAHGKDLAHGGESATRINLVAAWRESNVFTDAERAALELAEEGTRIADGRGVPDEVWENAAKHYDEAELADLLVIVSLINASNRMGVINRQLGGDYTPGQFGY